MCAKCAGDSECERLGKRKFEKERKERENKA